MTLTREEAIKILNAIRVYECYPKSASEETKEAIDMAIEALTEPINCVKCKHYYETEDDTDVHGHCRMDTAHTNLISRADALRELNGACSNWKDDCKVAEIINALPSSDAVQGEWKIDEYGIYHCPFCHAINNTVYKSFCPNCGARMYKGGDDE